MVSFAIEEASSIAVGHTAVVKGVGQLRHCLMTGQSCCLLHQGFRREDIVTVIWPVDHPES